MKQLLITIAAVVLVGCGDPTILLPGGGKSIYRASSEGKIEEVKKYLASGADVNAKDRHGNTPLIYAETKQMIELLVTSGANVNVRDRIGRTLLHKASKRKWGDRETVELLISNGADINAKRSNGAIPLHYAVYYDRIENVKILLSKGADLNARDGDQNGATPLHEAAWRSRKEIVDLLLSKGADVNDKDNDGHTPLDLAVQHKRADNIDFLRKHGGRYSTINMAATAGDTEAVKKLLTTGTYVESKDESGASSLYLATENGKDEVVKYLVENGANPNAKTKGEQTPLHIAAYEGHDEIIELLVKNGANLNPLITLKGSFSGMTPVDFAIRQDKLKTAALLRKHGGKTGEELKAEGK